MSLRATKVSAFEQQIRQPVMRARQLRIELQRTPVRTNRVVELSRFGERDGHVLKNARIVGLIAKRQTVRGKRRIEIALALQRERLGEVIDALRPDMFGVPAEDPAPPGHGIRGDENVRRGCAGARVDWGSARLVAPRPQSYRRGSLAATALPSREALA